MKVFLTFSNLASWMSVASFWFLAGSLALRQEKTFSNYYRSVQNAGRGQLRVPSVLKMVCVKF